MLDAIDPTRSPIVQITETNEAMADSRDVAAYFGKEHRNVTRAIEHLVAQDKNWGMRNFEQTPYVDAQNGQTYNSFKMTRSGFSMLAMGFTGGRAFTFKVKYIEAFDLMEAELRNREPTFTIPATYAEALRLAADQSERLAQQEAQIATLVPKAEGYDRFLNAEGLIGLQDTGRALLCHPNLFIKTLFPKYCFRDGARIVARQEFVVRGLFENKPFDAPNGKVYLRAWMTAKGLDYFSTRIPDHIKSRGAFPAVSKREAA